MPRTRMSLYIHFPTCLKGQCLISHAQGQFYIFYTHIDKKQLLLWDIGSIYTLQFLRFLESYAVHMWDTEEIQWTQKYNINTNILCYYQ
jgi:hypothetical protein